MTGSDDMRAPLVTFTSGKRFVRALLHASYRRRGHLPSTRVVSQKPPFATAPCPRTGASRRDDPPNRREASTITANDQPREGRNRSIRTCTTVEIEYGQLKTSLDVSLSDAAADVLWRIIDRARKTRQT